MQFHSTGPASPTTVNIKNKGQFITVGYTVGVTESSIVLPAGTVAFQLRAAESSKAILTFSSASGGTAALATSDEIPKYCSWKEEYLNLTAPLTIYIKSDLASTPVQLTYWT